jgi:amino acid transporter
MSVAVSPRPVDPAKPPLGGGGDNLKRDVSRMGLLWASEGSVIGTGWLFGVLIALTIAGPASLIGWVIGSAIIVVLGLVYAELGGMFPVSGGGGLFPQYAFGSLAGASFGWFGYLQAAAYAPIEVIATLQYLSTSKWASGLYDSTHGTLTGAGIGVAIGLLLVFLILNLIGIRWVERTNNGFTIIKVAIPLLAVATLLATSFHAGNFTAGGGFFPSGISIPKALMLSLPFGGIIFAFTGFEQATQIGGESRNPRRDIPFAVIGSVLIAAVIYILLQFAFIGSLNPATILHAGTWANLANNGALSASPLYTVAVVAGLGWLAWTLKAASVISPGACGLVYVTTTARLSYGMSRDGYVPSAFEKTSKKERIPWFSLLIAFGLGILFLLPFPSFGKLVGVVTSATMLMYVGAPLALGALRKNGADLHRSYSLPAAGLLAPLAFVFSTLIVYWAGWQTYSTLMVGVAIAPKIDWAAAKWLFPYLIGLGFISYFGGFGQGGIIGGISVFKNILVGGNGDLPLYWDLLVVTVFSLAIYSMAMASRLSKESVEGYTKDLFVSPTAPAEVTRQAA